MKIKVALESASDQVQVQHGNDFIQVEEKGGVLCVCHNGKVIWEAKQEKAEKALGADRPIVVFDLETTGMSPANDRIIQFSAVKLNEKLEVIDQLDISLNPGKPISPGASKVHGWYDKDVADSPPFEKMAPKIVKFLKGADFCGHNLVNYDLKMLMAEFERHTKYKVNTSQSERRLLDTLKASRKLRKGRHDLAECFRHYCGKEIEDAHDGLADATATAEVLKGLLAKEKVGLNQVDMISRGIGIAR